VKKNIAIIGKGGFGREVRCLIEQINNESEKWNFIGYFDDQSGESIDGYPVLGKVSDVNNIDEEIFIVVAVGDSTIRKNIVVSITNPNVSWPVLIHPSVQMDIGSVQIGKGSIICGNSILTTNIEIGNFFIMNLGCIVGHDVKIADFCSMMPSVNISGGISIGQNCFIGTGVKIINDLNIGNKVILGAGAIVIKDIPDHATAVGNPARIIKINE
jgi:sugar O-acyltransferase (sialic acid O-acetyltransferase NeuD family)